MKKVLFILVVFASLSSAISSDAAAKKSYHRRHHAQHDAAEKPVRGPLFTFKGGDSYDFGNVRRDDIVSHTYQFTNTGDRTIHIDNVTINCGAAVVKWDVEPILPGGKGHVTVTINSRDMPRGPFYKELYILSDAKLPTPEKYYTLFVSGNAETESYKVHDNRVAGW